MRADDEGRAEQAELGCAVRTSSDWAGVGEKEKGGRGGAAGPPAGQRGKGKKKKRPGLCWAE